jgi:hypothetical protein
MFNSGSIPLSNLRYVAAGTLILVLLAALPLTAAAGHANSSSLSGDGIYDPAAGGFARLSGISASSSGDDLYDPAAGFAGFADRSVSIVASISISGDADYDPAAGGLAALSTFPLSAALSDVSGCYLAALPSSGGFSGDDAYDPAAGGNPDGEIFGFACLLSTTGMQ